MAWETRKHGSRKQKGLKFKGEGRDQLVDRDYLASLVKESLTHDINDVIVKLKREGQGVSVEYREAEGVQMEAAKTMSLIEQKMAVIQKVLETLRQIRSTGRTRVGDGELRGIMRNAMAELKVSPEILKEISIQ